MNEELTQNPFKILESRIKSMEDMLTELKTFTLSSATFNEPKFYSVAGAAKKLGVAEITIYRNVQNGTIPFKRIGTRIMIPGTFVDK